MNRRDILFELRDLLEGRLWAFGHKIENTLSEYMLVKNIDPEDAAAIGAVVHSTLPRVAAELGDPILSCVRKKPGPGNKLEGKVSPGGVERRISVEWHFAGPRGGVKKSKHQDAAVDVEEVGILDFGDGFEPSAPPDLLMFAAYFLSATRSIERLHLRYADGVDAMSIELHRPATASGIVHVETPPLVPAASVLTPKGTTIKVKKARKGEGDVGKDDKRGDGSSGA